MKTLLSGIFLISCTAIHAQPTIADITQAEKKTVIDSLCSLLDGYYIFPEKCVAARQLIQDNFKKKKYEPVSDPRIFADRLTDDIRSVISDRHFRLYFDPEQVAAERNAAVASDSSALILHEYEAGKEHNFGFDQVKILDGNIGYINITGFHPLKYSTEPINAAMAFLQNVKALIIDLRNNRGGASDMGPYLSSFFFSAENSLLLYDLYTRDGKTTIHEQARTAAYVQGSRQPGMDLYLLTSSFSFSASEALAYTLQSLGRATIVGQQTAGGAHMWTGKVVTDRFYAHIPYARPVDPRTGTNWEGTGVTPNIKCASKDALTMAHIQALERLQQKDTAGSAIYQWHLAAVRAALNAIDIPADKLRSYAGRYGDKAIEFSNGILYLKWNGTDNKLIPLAADCFRVEGFNYFRLKFLHENNRVAALQIINDNGSTREYHMSQ